MIIIYNNEVNNVFCTSTTTKIATEIAIINYTIYSYCIYCYSINKLNIPVDSAVVVGDNNEAEEDVGEGVGEGTGEEEAAKRGAPISEEKDDLVLIRFKSSNSCLSRSFSYYNKYLDMLMHLHPHQLQTRSTQIKAMSNVFDTNDIPLVISIMLDQEEVVLEVLSLVEEELPFWVVPAQFEMVLAD